MSVSKKVDSRMKGFLKKYINLFKTKNPYEYNNYIKPILDKNNTDLYTLKSISADNSRYTANYEKSDTELLKIAFHFSSKLDEEHGFVLYFIDGNFCDVTQSGSNPFSGYYHKFF